MSAPTPPQDSSDLTTNATASISPTAVSSITNQTTEAKSDCGSYSIKTSAFDLNITLDLNVTNETNTTIVLKYGSKEKICSILGKNSFHVDELCPCTSYQIEVTQESCKFKGEPATTDCPGLTVILDAPEIRNTSITLKAKLQEKPNISSDCGVNYQYYCIIASQGKGVQPVSKNETINNLKPYTNYTCNVSATINNMDIGNATKTIRTDIGVPSWPLEIWCQTRKQDSIEVAWNARNAAKNWPTPGYQVKCGNGVEKNTTSPFTCHDLGSYQLLNISVTAFYLNNKAERINGTPIMTNCTSKAGKPSQVQDVKLNLKSNTIHVTCKKPLSNTRGPDGKYSISLEPGKNRNMNTLRDECDIKFHDLSYHTKYTVKILFWNGEEEGEFVMTSTVTGYNEKALIGFLAFLIIVTSIALIIVLYKIYLLQRRNTGRSDESLELIDKDEDKQLLTVEPIQADFLLETYKQKIADEGRLFLAEFQSIPRVFTKFAIKEAKKSCNQIKNRYVDILPYDYNRVSLAQISNEPGSDYINASYIDGFKEPRKYIAAQGPKDETTDDFWRMVWEQKTTVIVMVTRCEEGNRNKCAQYWPTMEKGQEVFGDITVHISEEKICPDYIIRKINITHSKEKGSARDVTHIQFMSWPDHGVPDDAHLLLKLRRRVNAFNNLFSGPIIVHCSAGVGRTGTYIGIDAMMEGLEAEGVVDVYGYIVKLRRQRCLMVQVEAQYILIHQALVEHNQFGDNEVSLSELPAYLVNLKKHDPPTDPSFLESQCQRIPAYKNWRSHHTGNQEENKSKNRYPNVLPYDFNRVPVKMDEEESKASDNEAESDVSSDEDSDCEDSVKYINASFIDGYWSPKTLIATQGPVADSIADFWQMIFQRKVKVIVMLTDCKEGDQVFCEKYWEDEKQTYEDMDVNLCDSNQASSYTIRVFEVKNKKRKESRKVYQYHYHKWSGLDLPEDGSDLVNMIRVIKQKLPSNSLREDTQCGKSVPVVIHCSDGSKRTGVFCALWNLLDSADTENVVDVFCTVRTLRKQRMGMLSSFEQYEFLYDTIASTYPVQNGDVQSKNTEDGNSCTLQVVNETKNASQDKPEANCALLEPKEDKENASTEDTTSTNKAEPAESSANGPTTSTEPTENK
nr:PREDICTED: receptor-type tyrosine-protein phosphatase C [Latimeria chalumnae]|eukprot:XP_014347810.1 PREDICTED: receptor-type tyrosine-protein phosphatase C [Latimeria chalumnae]